MNYAATLTIMVVLAFCFPISVRLAAQLGMPEGFVTTLLVALVIFSLAAYLVRWQVGRHSVLLERLAQARAQIAADPENPRAYFVRGEHLGKLLLRLDRRREAAEVIDRYSRLGGARESEIVALREALGSAERRRRRAEHREA
ncbi:hypothetical protein [Deinococcus sp.]|uniref:hypothetical protein n=1 Tax=Deinococcus sp. TaxID=47478 RepID=UPI0025BCEA21|nr:hypothetical protein [Deinococcus sp.]